MIGVLQDTVFALLANGGKLRKDIEREGALAFYVPLEGGYEGRYIRRLRAAGYAALPMTARGLGDPASFLMDNHGVRPPHLGKRAIRRYFVPPIVHTQLDTLPDDSKGLVLRILAGFMLSRQVVEYLVKLPEIEPRVKVIVEMGGDRALRWKPLKEAIASA